MTPPTPRRFAPEPVETTTKFSRQNAPSKEDDTPKPARRFAVEPMETMSKSSKMNKGSMDQETPPSAPRRFAPQAIETTSRSNHNADPAPAKPKSRILPQPVENSTKSNRRNASPEDDPPSPKSKQNSTSSVRRKFAPQLIDESKRTRKSNDTGSALLPTDKTDMTPGVAKASHHNSGQKMDPHRPKPSSDIPRFVMPFERRIERSHSRGSTRSHSFRLPDLETIESSESENSNPPSLSTSPSSDSSPLTTSDAGVGEMYKHATRVRESIDESFSRYLLEIEQRRTEQKLQEQALAAFPNSDFHEPVEHYVDDEEGSEDMAIDDRPATWEGHDEEEQMEFNERRRSTTGGNWEMQEMQRHHEQLEQERNANSTTRRRSSTKSPWWNDMAGAGERDPEMGRMLDRARPPMLGSDIRFPRSASPEPARFDVTQGSSKLREQMCYLTEISEAATGPDGLWGKKSQKSTMKSGASAKSTSSQIQGLWGGMCIDDGTTAGGLGGLAPPSGPTGLMTPLPINESGGNPFESSFKLTPFSNLPITPPVSGSDSGPVAMSGIDIVLHEDNELDKLMDDEFPDSFITQVYNYLSLGYPTLARPFDEELSKISHVPMSELRHDDAVAETMPKGYIRIGEDFEGRGDGSDQTLKDGGCARWRALREYVREWARQEKGMVKTDDLGSNFGTGARRGSWAW